MRCWLDFFPASGQLVIDILPWWLVLRLIFSRIPKTAGTSAFKMMAPYTSVGRPEYFGNVNKRVPLKDYPAHPLAPDWTFLTGHLSVATLLENTGLDRLATDILFFSVVRDPIDRLLSLYNFVATNRQHASHERSRRIGGIAFLRGQAADSQFNWLCPPQGLKPKWQVMIAPLEDVDNACREVIRRFSGQDIPAEALGLRENVSARRYGKFPEFVPLTRESLPADLLAELTERNSRDLALCRAIGRDGRLRQLPDRDAFAT